MALSNQVIAEFLRHIPQSNQAKATLTSLYTQPYNPNELATLYGICRMLDLLGVVLIHEADVIDQVAIQASSQTAKYTLISIADYIEADTKIISDWETRGMKDNILANGATFLQAIEKQRLQYFKNPTPSRHVKVAQVLIKRMNPQTGDHELLFQFDKNANQFQLIGGRWSEKDGDNLQTTIIREIEEELPLNELHYPKAYQLNLMIENLAVDGIISSTFGALTHYDFWLYHMINLNVDLVLQPEDQWIPIPMILERQVEIDGRTYPFMNPSIYSRMDQLLPNGLIGLPISTIRQ